MRHRPVLTLAAVAAIALAPSSARAGSREERAEIFDFLLEKTLERTAFSPEKPATLGMPEGATMAEHVRREMLRQRDGFLDAETDEELFYALSRLSGVRRDAHLRVLFASKGLQLPPEKSWPRGPETPHAPVRFRPDYGDPEDRFLFVSDHGLDLGASRLAVGDRVVSINGVAAAERFERVAPYLISSTDEFLWWKIARTTPGKFVWIPPEFYRGDDVLALGLEKPGGERYEVELPYLPYGEIRWLETDDHPYFATEEQQARPVDDYREAGYERVYRTPTYDLYVVPDESEAPLLLRWHRFSDSIQEDVERLLGYAHREERMASGVIFDATRSLGGSLGAWTLQRLQPRPFKMTFGNIRISDVTAEFLDMLEEYVRESMAEAPTPAAPTEPVPADRIFEVDSGRYLLDWIEEDARPALASGQAYTNDVPFKSFMLPRFSDGWVHPAPEHLEGPMVLLLGPNGCSHIDQFAAMFIDNRLGESLGMPAGGCSNTWEWTEKLKWPRSGDDIVGYMWTIGHTIRPNGQVLEGNPARVSRPLPLTRESFEGYEAMLLREARAAIDATKASGETHRPTR